MSDGGLRLVVGDDEFLTDRAVAAVIDAVRAADPGTMVEDHAAGDMSAGDLMAAVSPALFGGARVVVVRGGQDARKDLTEAILSYVAAPEPDLTFVLTHSGGAKGKALVDALRAAGAAVAQVPRPRFDQLRMFVRDEFRRAGTKSTDAVVDMLIEAVGSGTRELAAACQQLVADTDGRVEPAVVARYYRGRAESDGYSVSDAVMAGDLPGAVEALRWALKTGVDPVPIAAALADGVRTAARVSAAMRGGGRTEDPKSLAGPLGMHWFKVKKAQGWLRGWSPEALAQAMRIIGTCNVDVRGGAEDRDYALERAVTAIVALHGSGSGRVGGGRARRGPG